MSQPVDKLEMPTPINGEISFYFDAERLQHPIYWFYSFYDIFIDAGLTFSARQVQGRLGVPTKGQKEMFLCNL